MRNTRDAYLKRKYGISLEQYTTLLRKQGYRCAVCKKPASEEKQSLAVDHNHKTLEIRGALCFYCNHRVVGRHTNADLLQAAADYLRQGTGWLVPVKKKRRKRRSR